MHLNAVERECERTEESFMNLMRDDGPFGQYMICCIADKSAYCSTPPTIPAASSTRTETRVCLYTSDVLIAACLMGGIFGVGPRIMCVFREENLSMRRGRRRWVLRAWWWGRG